jgi:hypothetical protein
VEVLIDLFNQGNLVDRFKLNVTGLSPSWVSIPPEPAELMPGSTTTQTVSIHPPKNSSAKAGLYPYQITVTSTAVAGEKVTESGQVTVTSFERFLTLGRIKANTLPDVDIDISATGRDKVIEYLQNKYKDGFCRISTDSLLKLKSSIKDAERAILGNVTNETEKLCRKSSKGSGESPAKRRRKQAV